MFTLVQLTMAAFFNYSKPGIPSSCHYLTGLTYIALAVLLLGIPSLLGKPQGIP